MLLFLRSALINASLFQEQMMRKKAVQALDSRLSTMIENAYYYCNPPDRQKVNDSVL